MLVWATILFACGEKPPEYCVERNRQADQAVDEGVDGYSYDEDCDGVPDELDQCERSPLGDLTDRKGCTSGQAAGCYVLPEEPLDGSKLKGSSTFRWSGDCEIYVLQFSDDVDFHPARTRTGLRTNAKEVVIEATERYWRVVGGRDGDSSDAVSAPQGIKWR